MTKPNETTPPPTTDERPTYEGSRFPWWIALYFVAFLIFAVVYHLLYAFPDLRLWLTDAAGQMWK